MKFAASIFALLIVCALSTGCATIVTGAGEDQAVRFASNPRGATVYVDDNPVGQTPLSVRLTRKDEHLVRIEHPGYKPYQRKITSGFNEWILGNIFIGGLIGIGVDLLSGANPALDTNNISAKMMKDPNTVLVAVPPATASPLARQVMTSPPPAGAAAAGSARPAAYMNATPPPAAAPSPAPPAYTAPSAPPAPAYTPPPAYQPPPPPAQQQPAAPAVPAPAPAPARPQPQPAPAKPYQGW